MDSGQAERLIKVLTQIERKMPTPPDLRGYVPLALVYPEGTLSAWIDQENQEHWVHPDRAGTVPPTWRRLYVKRPS